jgi:diguanylate cyclase (GGDEF)-like protein/PAS domain S-box-containing protein
MQSPLKVLMLEDVAADAELAERALRRFGLDCALARVETEAAFRAGLEELQPDIVLSDFSLPAFDGFSALKITRELAPDTPFIFISGTMGEEAAINALHQGAVDYVLKGNLLRLPSAVERALRLAREQAGRRRAEAEYRRAMDDLKASVERFAMVAQATNDVIWDWDVARDTLWWNEGFGQRFGYGPGDLAPGMSAFQAIIHPDERARVRRELERALSAGTRYRTDEYRLLRKDGSVATVLDRGYVLRDGDGRAVRVIGALMDITQRKQHEDKIQRLNRVYGVLSGINTAIVRIHDRGELFTEACRIAIEHGNFRLSWIGLAVSGTKRIQKAAEHGASAGSLCLNTCADAFNAIARRVMQQQQPLVCNALSADSELSFMQETARACGCQSLAILPLVVAGQGQGVLMLGAQETGAFHAEECRLLTELAADISFAMDYIEKEEQLNYLAYYDALTGFPNRTLFYDRLQQQLDAARRDKSRLALLVVDIERFRYINDICGRHVGDALLKAIAGRLQGVLDETGRLARLGGDRFAVIVFGARDETTIARLVEQGILATLRQPLHVEEREFSIACKIGIALYPNDAEEADGLLADAEAALVKAKQSGEQYLFYTPAMNRRVAESLVVEHKLRRAQIYERFVMHYQPKFDLMSGHISGIEALIRWHDEEVGLVEPVGFIPVLEATGMILEVGSWVLHRAAADWERWRAAGLKPPPIAVNVSALQFRQARFVDEVQRVVAATGAQNLALELEITESIMMEDIERNVICLKRLREMGIGVAIDDFGTGYSSLSYVAKLPVDALKIDRSFIENVGREGPGQAIVSTIVSLAHSLNLKVIAEGIETEAQAAFLKAAGCEEGQGYLFSRPLTAEVMAAQLQQAWNSDPS